MSSLIVYVTRPGAYEIFMGGYRSLQVWLVRPCYSHESFSTGEPDRDGKDQYRDEGWLPQRSSLRIKPLLKQSKPLWDAVWHEVFLSVCPKGMDDEAGTAWCSGTRPAQPGDLGVRNGRVANWRFLADDREWEGRCNTSHKRFLLEVDLLSATARRVAPRVHLRRLYDGHLVGESEWVETDQITSEMATEYWHSQAGPNSVPF